MILGLKQKTLSVIIPVYNEENTILELLDLVEKVELEGVKKRIN